MSKHKLTKRLGELLIDHEVITTEQLNAVLAQQQQEGGRIGSLLVHMGILTEPELLGFVAEQLGLPLLDLNKTDIDPQAVKLLSEVYARRHRALVIKADDTDATVVLSDPADLDTQDAISNLLAPRQVHLAVALQSQLFDLYDHLYRRTDDIAHLAEQLQGENAPSRPTIEASGLDDSDATVAKLLYSMFEDALQVGASDIHIEPDKKLIRFRMRVDGLLQETELKEVNIGPAIVSRLKIMAGLDISERRLPQDGRFALTIKNSPVDIRMATMPVQFGEAVVLRLLDQSQGIRSLDKAGMPPELLSDFRRKLASPNGIILVTGPTGSGKTTTLNVCPKAEPVSSYGYVYGSATIPSVSSSSTNEFTVKEGGGNSLAIYDSKLAINNGSKIKLPLEVTFDKADKVDLVLADTDGREFPVSVTFVPKSLGWVAQSAENGCGEGNSKFNYVANSESCKAIGVAGTSVNLVLEARGEGGKKIDNYEVDLGNNALQVNELDANYESQVVSRFPMNFSSNNETGTTLSYNAEQVALIKAQVKEHYAPYIEDRTATGVKVTDGHTLIIGRTVPASLNVFETTTGKIKGGKVYAQQPNPIEFKFDFVPKFVVQGLDAQGESLTSYTGEFAAGLYDNSEIKLETTITHSGIQLAKPIFDTEQPGNHVFELDASSLVFAKNKRFDEASLHLPLQLTINDHDTYTKGLNSDNNNISSTFLAAEDDTLRFGYLLLHDTETSYSQEGVMKTELRYFDKNGNSESDSDTEYDLTSPLLTATIVTESGSDANKPPTLTVEEDHIKVSPQADKQWKGKVTLKVENASKADEFIWLKPAKDDGTGLTDPKADLTLSGRKRGNDKVFNRREVIR